MGDDRRVRPGPHTEPAPARAELREPGGRARLPAGRLARRRVGAPRRAGAGRARPAGAHRPLFSWRVCAGDDATHAGAGRGGGRPRAGPHGAAGHRLVRRPGRRGGRGRHVHAGRSARREHAGRRLPRPAGGVLVQSPAARPMTDLFHLAGTFLWLSLIAVGGGLGVLPEMQRQVVTRYGWVTTREFVDGYTLAQLTPGPNMLVAIFVGYGAHGLVGALVAGTAMFVPTSSLTGLIARRGERLRRRPWAPATRRGLAPGGVGPMAARVSTLRRPAGPDRVTARLAAAGAVV